VSTLAFVVLSVPLPGKVAAHDHGGSSGPSGGGGYGSRGPTDSVPDYLIARRRVTADKAREKAVHYYFETVEGLQIRLSNQDDQRWLVEVRRGTETVKQMIYFADRDQVEEPGE